MNGRVVSRPELGHACSPGWTTVTTGPESKPFGAGTWAMPGTEVEYPEGTVWECECGQGWVSLGGVPGNRVPEWRKERRRERRRREGVR